MLQSEFIKMKDRAKTRKDGVYSLSPYRQYSVFKNQVVGYNNFIGPEAYEVYQLSYGFAHRMGTAPDKKRSKEMLGYAIYYSQNNL